MSSTVADNGLKLVKPGGYTTKQEYAYTVLKLSIANRHLRPGQRLPLKELCAELSVSASPVREALFRLEAEGLVRIVPHGGATVQEYSPHKVEIHFRIRAALDGLINSIAATRIAEAQLQELESLNRAMEAALEVGQADRWNDLNLRFHEQILEVCAESQISALFYQLREQGFRYRYFPSFVTTWAPVATREHWDLVDALRKRDPELAARVARLHTEHAGALVQNALEQDASRERNGDGAAIASDGQRPRGGGKGSTAPSQSPPEVDVR